MNHLSDAAFVHSPVKPLAQNEIVEFTETQLLTSELLDTLQEEVAAAVLARGDEFIKRLVDAMMEPPPELSPWVLKNGFLPGFGLPSGLGEILCRKHKHQGWCHRMYVLEKYTRLAVNYHHARKRFRWETSGKSMSLIVLYGGLRAEARAKFYSAECTCTGLGPNDEFQPAMSTDQFQNFVHGHNR